MSFVRSIATRQARRVVRPLTQTNNSVLRCMPMTRHLSSIVVSQVPRITAKRHLSNTTTFCQNTTTTTTTSGSQLPNTVVPLTTAEFHQRADAMLETLLDDLELLGEAHPTAVQDVELSQGVLTLTLQTGTYVVNKQPPNKQLWLSSPVSGPDRFDLLEGGWTSVRNGHRLLEVLQQELGHTLATTVDLVH